MIAATVVIPCFNEERRLRREGLRALLREDGTRLLFVDDGSTDNTLELLRELCGPPGGRAAVVALPRNVGKAEAVRLGMRAALDAGAPVVGYLDADLATPPEEMLRLLRTLHETGAQAVLGARIALLGARIHRHPSRHYLGRIFATAASLILDLPVYDTQCGAKAFRASAQLHAALREPFHARWAFDVELMGRLLAGTPHLPGISAHEFLEMPLRAWSDVGGSKLRPVEFPRLGLELLQIHRALRSLRRRIRLARMEPDALPAGAALPLAEKSRESAA